MLSSPMNTALRKMWYTVRYSSVYYRLSNFPKVYRQFSVTGHRLHNDVTKVNPFFIMACGRSGNTLLRAILCNNRKISIPPESLVLGEVYDKFRIFNHLRWDDLVKLIIGEFEANPYFKDWNLHLQPLYKELLQLDKNQRTLEKIIDAVFTLYSTTYFPEAYIWGDKTPENNLWMSKIKKIFPEAKYIFLFRDGRDVAASFLKSGLQQDFEKICHYWNLNMRLSEIFLKGLPAEQYIDLRYENLVQNPQEEMMKICRFLEVEFSESMLQSHTLFEKLGDAPNHEHHKNVAKPINTDSIGKWRRTLSEEEQRVATQIMQKYLKKYNYIDS